MKAKPSDSSSLPDSASRLGVTGLALVLESRPDLEQRDTKGRTALFRTARLGKAQHLKLLLAHGADPNSTDFSGEAPLQVAARYGHLDAVKTLVGAGAILDYIPDSELTGYSESALCSAVRKGRTEVVEFLLKAGASPNATSSAGRLPLLSAAGFSDTHLCKLLLQAGAYLDARGHSGQTALLRAVEAGRPDCVRLLLESGAQVNLKDDHGRSPILRAVPGSRRNPAVLTQLLRFVPDLTSRDPVSHQTPLEIALELGCKEAAKLLREAGSPPAGPLPELGGDIQISIELTETEIEQLTKALETGQIHLDEETDHEERNDKAADCDQKEGTVKSEPDVRSGVPQYLSGLGVQMDDLLLAEELSKIFVSAGTRANWKSEAHLQLLLHCNEPQSLQRMAYFARGYRNAPPGKELADASTVLGEPFGDAVGAFIASGLLRRLDDRELVERMATIADCKIVGRTQGTKVSGNRNQMLKLLLDTAGAGAFESVLKRGPLYVLTRTGFEALGADPPPSEEGLRELRSRVLEALLRYDLRDAALQARPLASPRDQLCRVDPLRVAWARIVLTAPIPEVIHRDQANDKLLRAIAAAHVLCHVSGDRWSTFSFVAPPTRGGGKPISPFAFAYRLRYGRFDEHS
jgi:ankyrin repeat protein